MPRVVPSQIVALLETTFPSVANSTSHKDGVGAEYVGILRAIAGMVREIPDELITITGDDYADFVAALGTIESAVERWTHRGSNDTIGKTGRRGVNAIALLNLALKKCSDEAPAASTAGLPFISDVDLRESIRRDISAAERDLIAGEFKGATVLAVAASEALLLWALQHRNQDRLGNAIVDSLAASAAAAMKSNALTKQPPSNPEEWTLHQYVEVSLARKLIADETATQVRVAKDFRNLIHPGRAQRLSTVCDKGTAHAALASVSLIVRDLS